MTSLPDDPKPEIEIEAILPLLPNAVRIVHRIYGHYPNPDEVNDLVQDIVLLLIENDGHVLHSFRGESSKKTWLQTVVNHYVLRFFGGQRNIVSLEDVTPNDLAYQPSQEDEVWIEEAKKLLAEMASELTEHERQLLEFIKQGLRTGEIAALTGIEPDSVSRSKRRLFDKIEERLRLMLGWQYSDAGGSSKSKPPEN